MEKKLKLNFWILFIIIYEFLLFLFTLNSHAGWNIAKINQNYPLSPKSKTNKALWFTWLFEVTPPHALTNLLLRIIPFLPQAWLNYLQVELRHEYSHWSPFQNQKLPESTLISCFVFLFIRGNFLLHWLKLLCQAGFSLMTVSPFIYPANTMSVNSLLMHAVPLTFRERSERRHQHTRHNPPRARGSLLFLSFLKTNKKQNIILLC